VTSGTATSLCEELDGNRFAKRHRNDISNVPVADILKFDKGGSPGMSVGHPAARS
jgi:hypothetical protein